MKHQKDNTKSLPIVTGKKNSVLRAQSIPVARVDARIKGFISQMYLKMEELEGIGLAAPQVGENIQLFIVDKLAFDEERSKWQFEGITEPDVSGGYTFINPIISTYPKPYEDMEEGCLSLPGLEGVVKRSRRVTIKAQNEKGERFKLRAEGLLAKVLQHEYDHLQGTLISDKWKNPRRYEKETRLSTSDRYLSVVFFGSPPYGDIVLEALRGAGIKPLVVPKASVNTLTKEQYDVGILAAYGKILPPRVIAKFRHGILNIHPSLLPKYRGPSPVVQTILEGDRVSGVTIMKLSGRMDAGPIVAQQEVELQEQITGAELSRTLFGIGAELLLHVLPLYLHGNIELVAQDEKKASYTNMISKEDGLIDWSRNAEYIRRAIYAYQPWPCVYTFFEHKGIKKRIQLLEAGALDGKNVLPRTVYGTIEEGKDQLIVLCGQGRLRIKKLRPEGKKEMTGEEFLRGYDAKRFVSK